MSHDRKRLQQTVAADPCLPFPTFLSAPPRSSALNWKSTQNTGTFCHFCRKARPARTRHPPRSPPPPSYPALGNSLPPLSPFKSKNQAPGLLGAGFVWGHPSWAAEGRHGSERSRGQRPGGYLGTEGGEAGELGGAGSHTSHRRSAGGSGRSDSRVLREDLPQSLNVNDKKRGCSGRR